MFKYILLMLTLVSTSVWAQRTAMPARQIQTTTTIPSNEKADDTEILYPGNWEQADEFFLYTVPDDGGFVVGTNVYGDLSKAQQFDIDAPLYLHGVYFWFAGKTGETGTVDFNVWDFDDQPGDLLVTHEVSLEQITISDELADAYYYEFPGGPILVERPFLLGFYLGNLGSSSLGMVSSADGQGGELGLAWEQWDNGAWYTFLDPDGWGLDIDLGIFPLIEWADDDPGPGTEGISNIRVAQRTDGSGLVDVTYDFTADPGQYLVDLALSLDGGSTYDPVNPAYLSNHWPVTPGNDRQLLLDAGRVAPGASTDQARLRLTPRSGLLVTTAPASGITSEAATIAGEVLSDGGYAITARGVAYGTVPNPLRTGTSVSGGSGTGRFTTDITGLMPNTTYYARAWATNNQGTEYGNQIGFTTLAEGPMVIHGPGGATITIPEAAEQEAARVTLEEHPPVTRQNEQAASVAFRVHMDDGQQTLRSQEDFTITLPVTLKNPDPESLFVMVKMENGALAMVPGTYDSETASFQIKTFGMAKDWVFNVVAGQAPTVVYSAGKSSTAGQQAEGEKIWDWPSLDFVIYDYSDADPRPLGQQAITEHILPLVRDVLITLQSTGYAAPRLQMDSQNRYEIILADTLPYSYYEPPYNQLLGRIFIDYPSYIDNYSDPATWRLANVIMHETFHSVQQSYDVRHHADNSIYMASQFNRTAFSMCASSAYDEGTASMVGATYERAGSLTSGAVYVDPSWASHDLGYPVDDFIDSSPYTKQDFFVFIAKRFFNSNLTHLDPLYLGLGSEISTPLKRNQATSDYLLQLRKDFDFFLRSSGTSLPRAYTEYALQRLYLHSPEYLLRETEHPSYGGDDFIENRLADNLLESSQRHKDWISLRNDTIDLEPVSIGGLRPLSSTAITLTLPTDIPADDKPDKIEFMINLSGGAEANNVMDEEGIGIMVVRARDEHGTAVENDAVVVVSDLEEAFEVDITGNVTHLVFLFVNAYVNEVITDINIEVFNDEIIYDFPGIAIQLGGPMVRTDGSAMPTGVIAWSNNDIPALTWSGRQFSSTGKFNYADDEYDISITGRISPDGKKIETLHATSMNKWAPTESIYREIIIQNFPLKDINPPWVAGSNIPGNEAEPMVTKLIYERKFLNEDDQVETIGLQSVDWGSQQTELSVHFSFMHSAR